MFAGAGYFALTFYCVSFYRVRLVDITLLTCLSTLKLIMGFDKPNDEQYPPMPLQGDGGCMFASREGGTVDCGQNFPSCTGSADFSFPYVSLANSAWNDMHATHHSYPHDLRNGSHWMTGLMGLDNLQSQDNLNLHSLGGNVIMYLGHLRASERFYPEGTLEKRSVNQLQ